MPVLPRVKDYDTLYREFRWPVPARYNIGVDVCDRWAQQEPDRLAILHVPPDGRDEPITYGWLRDTSNRLANVLRAHGIARGDRVAILLPQSPEVAASHIGIYKLGGVALPLAVLFGTDALSLPAAEFRRRRADHQRPRRRAHRRNQERSAQSQAGAFARRRRRWRAWFRRQSGARVVRFHAGRYIGRRSRDDGLHVRHDRPAQGRVARPSRADRAFARRRDASRFPAAARRPHLDAGRLGLGGRPAQCAVAGPALWRAGRCAPVREIRSGRSLCADGARADPQCLHPADRAAHVARGTQSERPPRDQHAFDRLRAASRWGRKPTSGESPRSALSSTNSTARPNATSCSRPAVRWGCPGPAPSASRSPATRWR